MQEVPFAIWPIGSLQDNGCISSEEATQMINIKTTTYVVTYAGSAIAPTTGANEITSAKA